MWLFLSFGFFSVVVHNADPELLLIRARCREDLEAFRERMKKLGHGMPPLRVTPEADYPFRVYVTRSAAQAVVAHELATMGATNFKDAIAETDASRASTYLPIWRYLKDNLA